MPEAIARYKNGLKRLEETEKIVDDLKKSLVEMLPKIDQKNEDTKNMVVMLQKEQQIASVQEKENEV